MTAVETTGATPGESAGAAGGSARCGEGTARGDEDNATVPGGGGAAIWRASVALNRAKFSMSWWVSVRGRRLFSTMINDAIKVIANGSASHVTNDIYHPFPQKQTTIYLLGY